jgi:hypothetical protein
MSKLAKRISEQATFLWGIMEEISSKAAVNDALRPIRAISRIATTITAHRLDRVVIDLVNLQKVFSEYTERLEEDGWYIELDGWQDVFHLEASYHTSADTLTVAVRLPLLRRESRGYDQPSSPSCTARTSTTLGQRRKYLPGRRQPQATSTWTTSHSTGASRREQVLLQLGQGGHAGVTIDVFRGSLVARVEWHKVNVPPLVETCNFVGKEDQTHAHGGDGARGHGGPGAVPRESEAG